MWSSAFEITDISFRPPFGWVFTVIIVVAVFAIYAYWLYRDHHYLTHILWWWVAVVRLLAVVGVLTLLTGPGQYTNQDVTEGRVDVVILADTSSSMDTRDVVNSNSLTTRWEDVAGHWLNNEYIDQLRDVGASVSIYSFDDDHHLLDLSDIHAIPEGNDTDIFTVLRSVAERDLGVIVLLSDGRDTHINEIDLTPDNILNKDWPIISVAVGQNAEQPDLAVLAWPESDEILKGQPTTIHVAISQRGYIGNSIVVQLSQDGVDVATHRIDEMTKHHYEFVFEVIPESSSDHGSWVQGYQVTAAIVAHDTTDVIKEENLTNNYQWVFLNILDEQIKVLMLEGAPNWDSKYLGRVLSEDPDIAFSSIYALGPNRYVSLATSDDHNPSDRLRIDQLTNYDLVILGEHCDRFFDIESANMLLEYVRDHGGSLVYLRGQAFDESTEHGKSIQDILSAIEPVSWGKEVVTDLSIRITEDGRQSPLNKAMPFGDYDRVLAVLPGIITANSLLHVKPSSIVYMRQESKKGDSLESMPLVVQNNVGAGKVMAILGEGMWQWATLPASMSRYDMVYQIFWARMIRWLVLGNHSLAGQDYDLRVSRTGIEPGDNIELIATANHIRVDDDSWRINWIRPDGTRTSMPLERRTQQASIVRVFVMPEMIGVHSFSLQTNDTQHDLLVWNDRAQAKVAVYPQSIEMLDTSANPALLKRLSEMTGGLLLQSDETDKCLKYVSELRVARNIGRRWQYCYDHTWVLVALISLFGIQWAIGRREGLA